MSQCSVDTYGEGDLAYGPQIKVEPNAYTCFGGQLIKKG